MKKSIPLFITGLVLSVVLGFGMNEGGRVYDFFTISGLGNLLIAALFFIIALVCFIARKKELGQQLCIAAGLLLLCGTITCSIFPLNIH